MSSKQKKAIVWIGTTVAMYLSIRYILPLVVPFLIAGMVARMLFPIVCWLHKKTKLSETVATLLVLCSLFGLMGVGIWYFGSQFVEQLLQFINRIPIYMQSLEQWMQRICIQMESFLGVERNCISGQVQSIIRQMGVQGRDALIQWVWNHWITWIRVAIEMIAGFIIVFMAIIYWIKERHIVQETRQKSAFRREIALITSHVGRVGWAYVKVEVCIIAVTILVCIVGLSLLKNPYSVLLSICIGILDALPFFGTGLVFIPWIVVALLGGQLQQALILGVIYMLCYFSREIMESRLLGTRIGITSLETMIAMYIGLKLFGVSGLFTGPIAWILIKEIDKNIFLQ